MPNDVAQNRNTTLAADTSAGRSAGSVTVRNTWRGLAPSAAAASAGRASRDSQLAPTARITTATLKKMRPATIATGVPSRPTKPSGPASPSSWRNATPTTTVGSTNGTRSNARISPRPRKSSRCRAYAAGMPSSSDATVARPADHTVNQTTRRVRGRASTSSTRAGVERPVGPEPLGQHPGHRQHEEDAEHQHRPDGQPEDPGDASHAGVTAR